MVYPQVSVPLSVCDSFMDNSTYEFHQITLKLGRQLDHEVIESIVFQGYSTSNFDRVIMLF